MMQIEKRKPLIIGLGGTTRANSSSESATRYTLNAIAKLGADVEFFDGPSLALPMYAPEMTLRTAQAQKLVDALRRSDGIILGSPGYHGSMSGLLKNALDYTEDLRNDARPYFENRAVGCIVCATGWQAVGTTLIALRSVIHALRGWPTPLGVGINTVGAKVFDTEGECVDSVVSNQLVILAGQVLQFADHFIASEAGYGSQSSTPRDSQQEP
jgi:FMN reductase